MSKQVILLAWTSVEIVCGYFKGETPKCFLKATLKCVLFSKPLLIETSIIVLLGLEISIREWTRRLFKSHLGGELPYML
jgi:hypothetical protein